MPRFPNIPPFAKAVLILLMAIFLFNTMSVIIKHLGGRYPVQQLSAFRNLFGLIPAHPVAVGIPELARGRTPPCHPAMEARLRAGRLRSDCAILLILVPRPSGIGHGIDHRVRGTAVRDGAFRSRGWVTGVGIWRWLAVLIGFAGIMLVMRPGSDVFTLYTLLPLGAALSYSCASVSVRLIDTAVPTATINLYSHVGALIGSTALVVATNGYMPVASYIDWLWIFAIGILGGGAVLCINTAYRRTQPSSLSPFEFLGFRFPICSGGYSSPKRRLKSCSRASF